jgi:hypothetical protein
VASEGKAVDEAPAKDRDEEYPMPWTVVTSSGIACPPSHGQRQTQQKNAFR